MKAIIFISKEVAEINGLNNFGEYEIEFDPNCLSRIKNKSSHEAKKYATGLVSNTEKNKTKERQYDHVEENYDDTIMGAHFRNNS